MATRPAAEPRIRLLTIFMLTSKLLPGTKGRTKLMKAPSKLLRKSTAPRSEVDLSEPPKTGRPRDAPLRRRTIRDEQFGTGNKRQRASGYYSLFCGRLLQNCHVTKSVKARTNTLFYHIIMSETPSRARPPAKCRPKSLGAEFHGSVCGETCAAQNQRHFPGYLTGCTTPRRTLSSSTCTRTRPLIGVSISSTARRHGNSLLLNWRRSFW